MFDNTNFMITIQDVVQLIFLAFIVLYFLYLIASTYIKDMIHKIKKRK